MLVLTEAAAEVVKSVTGTPQAPDRTAGLRITQAIPAQGGAGSLELAAAEQPAPDDQVVEASGARVFLDPPAAAYLDDKVLDADVDAEGKVHFTLGTQNLRSE